MTQHQRQETVKVVPVCPICGEQINTRMVSDLYVEALGARSGSNYLGLSRTKWINLIAPQGLPKQDRLASLHPDMLASIVFIIIGYLFILKLIDSDPNAAVLGIGVAVLLLVYWFFRNKLIARFSRMKNIRNTQLEEVRGNAEIWMDLAFCFTDKVFFTADKSIRLTPEELLCYWKK